uniref:Putative secreted protein n=1 Tax=Ixodes ricinus TaxID=34613 RepID=A0A147BJD1_IXORI
MCSQNLFAAFLSFLFISIIHCTRALPILACIKADVFLFCSWKFSHFDATSAGKAPLFCAHLCSLDTYWCRNMAALTSLSHQLCGLCLCFCSNSVFKIPIRSPYVHSLSGCFGTMLSILLDTFCI